MLRIALREFSGEEYEFEGLITPSFVLACLHVGRTEPPSDELLASLFRIVGSEIFDLLGTRYNTISDPGPEIIELADTQFPEATHFASHTFQNAARAIPGNRTQFLPVDFLVTLTELLPEENDTLSSCPVLCGPSESFRSLLYPWLSQLSNNPSFPKDLSERLKNIRFYSSTQRTSRSSPTLPIVTPNIREWIDLTQQAMNQKFSEDLQAAIEIAYNGVTDSEIKQGVTTPRLLIASAMAGDKSANSSGFAAHLASAIGAERLNEMKLTLSQMLEMYGKGELSELKSEIVSNEVNKILSLANSESSGNNLYLGLEDVLKAIRKLRPRDCEIFARGRGLDRFWSEFEGWVFTAMSSSPSDPQTRQNPIKLQEGRNSTGMDREAALESVESQWKIFESKYKFASGFGLAATRARDVQKWLIQEAKALGPSNTHIPLSSIPFRISDEVVILGLLLTAAEVKKGNRSLASDQDIPWAKRVVDSAKLDSTQLKAQIQRALFRAKTTETNSTHFDLIPDTLGNLFIQAEQLSKQISDGVIDERHFVAAWFRSLIRVSDLGSSMSEFPDLGILFECLSSHVGKDQSVLQKDSKDGWRDLLSEIRDGLSAKPSRPEDSPVAPAEPVGPAFLQLDDATKSQISEFWNTSGIRPGNALSESLAAACIKNQSFPSQLTPGQLFVGLLDRGKFLSQNSHETDRTLEIILYRRLRALGGSLNDLWINVLENPHRTEAKPTVSKELLEVFQIANQLEAKCSPGSVYVAPRHFIAAILHVHSDQSSFKSLKIDPLSSEDLKEALNKHLPVFENHDSASAWAQHFEGRQTDSGERAADETEDRAATEEQTLTAGSLSEFHRDSASHEIGGSTKQYARAIASTFLSSGNGDFCFALFGPWGRGKSTLIQQVSEELNGKYTSVAFNAWKFPSRPEVWVWLYETLKKEASGDCLLNKLRLGIQSNLREDHGLPLVFPGLLLLFAAIPKGSLLSWTIPVNGIASIIAIALILLYSRRVWNGFGTTLADYLKLPNHGKHLGLQAAIGDDLKRLLATWTGAPLKTRNKPLDVITPPTFRSRVTKWLRRVFCPWEDEELPIPEGRIAHVRHLLNNHWWFSLAFVFFWISLAIAFGRIGPHATLSLSLAIAIFSLATIGFYFAILLPVLRSKTVLLVVDDLDRCPPEEMLAVIESLRVFLDDPVISPKLKIAMLLDREILSHAVCRKYEKLLPDSTKIPKPSNQEDPTGNRAPVSRFTTESIVTEQIEKFFLLSFDLPPLESKEAWDIAEKIVGKTVSAPSRETQTTSPTSLETVMARYEGIQEVPNTGSIPSQSSPTTSSPPPSAAKPNDVGQIAIEPLDTSQQTTKEVLAVQLTPDEESNMTKLLHSYLTPSPGHPTPRHMRMTKMRYFLARQILTELGSAPNPAELMKHFSHLWIDRRFDSKLAQVVGMVTGRTPEK